MDSRASQDLVTETDSIVNLDTLPAEILANIFSEFETVEAAKASRISKRIYENVQEIWRRRAHKHFPDAVTETKTNKSTNWINVFRELSHVYMNFSNDLARLHYQLKEGQSEKIIAQGSLPLSFILQMDNKQSSLLSLAKRSHDQRLLNFYYQCALNYFSNVNNNQLIDPSMRDTDKNTILHWAILCDQPLDIIIALITQGCDVNAKNSMGDTSLITAVRCGRLEVVEYLMEHPVDINWKDCTAQSAVYIAAATRRTDILRVLADNGADLNAHAFRYGAPICVAAINGDIDTVEFFLDHGEDIETDSLGSTLLHLAVENNHEALTRFLLKRGANIKEIDLHARTALFLATHNANQAMITLLLEHGAEINSRDITYKTPLHHAVVAGNKSLVRFLLANGANPSASDRAERVTPLHLAAALEDPEIVQILLDERIKVNAVMNTGATPLYTAAYYGHAESVAMLLKKGASIPLASNNNHKFSPLYVAAMNGHTGVIDVLLKQKIDIDETCLFGRTALYAAVKRGEFDSAKRLLELGADPNISNAAGRSPLHIAAKRGDIEMINLLISYRADPEARLIRSELTSLDLATRHGHTQAAQVIKEAVEARNNERQIETEFDESGKQLPNIHPRAAGMNRIFDFFSTQRVANTNNDHHHNRYHRR